MSQPSQENASSSMEVEEQQEETKVWLPGVHELEPGQTLDYDSSAYACYHKMSVEWPCLTFDIIRDDLGMFRTKLPFTTYLAAGTQAANKNKNKVILMKVSKLNKTIDDDAMDDESENEAEDPELEEKSFKHPGGVNRLRSMPQHPNVLATFSESDGVHIWDSSALLRSLDKGQKPQAVRAAYSFAGHPEEGFALDWSPVHSGHLLSGDCRKFIYLHKPTESNWVTDKIPFGAHDASVEDIQWSPGEPGVFASCSVDKTIRIWDMREKKRHMLFVAAHQTDVNVISWNRKAQHLVASGADDGSFKIWDLRNFKSNSPAASFHWHKKPVTSIEWSPIEQSVVAVASDDNSISMWDMALEAESEQAMKVSGVDVPPQLSFIHSGMRNVKEVHFHPQIPTLLVSTAQDGFDFFKPANLEVHAPPEQNTN